MDKRRRTRKKKIAAKPAAADAGRRYELGGIATVAVSAVSLCGLAGLNVGFIGFYFARFLRYFFGVGSWFFALLLLLVGAQLIVNHRGFKLSKRFLGVAVFYTMLLAVYHHLAIPVGEEILPPSLPEGGGLLGGGILLLVRKFFGVDGALIVLIACGVGSVLLATTWSLASGVKKTEKHAQEGLMKAQSAMETTYDKVREIRAARAKKESFYNQEEDTRFSGGAAVPKSKQSLREQPVPEPEPEPVEEEQFYEETFPVEEPVESVPVSVTESKPQEAVQPQTAVPESVQEPELPMPPSFTIEYSEEKQGQGEVYAPETPEDDEPSAPVPVPPAPKAAPVTEAAAPKQEPAAVQVLPVPAAVQVHSAEQVLYS